MNFNVSGKPVCRGLISIQFSGLTAERPFIDTLGHFLRCNTEAERLRAIGTLQTGNTKVQTAIVMDISHSGVSRLWARYQRYLAEANMPEVGL